MEVSAKDRWVCDVCAPLAEARRGLPTGRKPTMNEYNRVWEAVSRGDEQQGRALVAAVLQLMERSAQQPEPTADVIDAVRLFLHKVETTRGMRRNLVREARDLLKRTLDA